MIGRMLLVGVGLAIMPATAALAESYPPSLPTTTTTTTPSNPTTTTTLPEDVTTTTVPEDVTTTTVPGGSTTTTPELPETGSDVAPLVQAGIALVAVGGGIAVVATRRRNSAG